MFPRDRNPDDLPAGLIVLLLFSLLATGCDKTQSANQALEKSVEVNHVKAATVAKFSGTVSIDGQPPKIDRRNPLYVIAYDPKNPPKGRQLPFATRCDETGHFEFNTYGTGDGLPEGSYIVLFAMPKVLTGGDGLKNLYNDPDRNAKDKQFQLELTTPGKTDWSFDLALEGKEPNTTPGPNTIFPNGKSKG
jgi:hypothetical protein